MLDSFYRDSFLEEKDTVTASALLATERVFFQDVDLLVIIIGFCNE